MFEETYWINDEQKKAIDEAKEKPKEKSMKISDLASIKDMGKLD